LLETGGGILKAAPLLSGDEPFLVFNVDVITDINIHDLIKKHNESKSLATLCVRNRTTSRYLYFDDKKKLCGWENTKTGESIKVKEWDKTPLRFAFSGIHILDPKIFSLITANGRFSIITTYLELAQKHKISMFDHSNSIWFDMGKAEDLDRAEKIIPSNMIY